MTTEETEIIQDRHVLWKMETISRALQAGKKTELEEAARAHLARGEHVHLGSIEKTVCLNGICDMREQQ